MDINKIIETLEEMGVPSDKIDEIVAEGKKREKHPLKDGDELYTGGPIINFLETQYKEESDPIKKAIIAAKIISYNLEN